MRAVSSPLSPTAVAWRDSLIAAQDYLVARRQISNEKQSPHSSRDELSIISQYTGVSGYDDDSPPFHAQYMSNPIKERESTGYPSTGIVTAKGDDKNLSFTEDRIRLGSEMVSLHRETFEKILDSAAIDLFGESDEISFGHDVINSEVSVDDIEYNHSYRHNIDEVIGFRTLLAIDDREIDGSVAEKSNTTVTSFGGNTPVPVNNFNTKDVNESNDKSISINGISEIKSLIHKQSNIDSVRTLTLDDHRSLCESIIRQFEASGTSMPGLPDLQSLSLDVLKDRVITKVIIDIIQCSHVIYIIQLCVFPFSTMNSSRSVFLTSSCEA